jgi:hypothetical protein
VHAVHKPLTGISAEQKSISRKTHVPRGFSQDSLLEINMQPHPPVCCHVVKILYFPRWASRFGNFAWKA